MSFVKTGIPVEQIKAFELEPKLPIPEPEKKEKEKSDAPAKD